METTRAFKVAVAISLIVLILVGAVLAAPSPVLAEEAAEPAAAAVPDYSRKGSVTVEVRQTGTGAPVPGGTIELFRVARTMDVDGNPTFVLTDDFAGSGVSLEGIGTKDNGDHELAATLAKYASQNKVAGVAGNVASSGKITYANMSLGLYLVVQTKAAEGYDALLPFLVTVPMVEKDGSLLYDVNATPKPGTANKTTPGTTPPSSDTPPSGGSSGGSSGGKLPQTGQLWWPVPWLALGGVGLLVIGGAMRARSGRPQKA